jgi:hypothetical protein
VFRSPPSSRPKTALPLVLPERTILGIEQLFLQIFLVLIVSNPSRRRAHDDVCIAVPHLRGRCVSPRLLSHTDSRSLMMKMLLLLLWSFEGWRARTHHMDLGVSLEVRMDRKGPPTDRACERFFARVRIHVRLSRRRPDKAFATDSADVVARAGISREHVGCQLDVDRRARRRRRACRRGGRRRRTWCDDRRPDGMSTNYGRRLAVGKWRTSKRWSRRRVPGP